MFLDTTDYFSYYMEKTYFVMKLNCNYSKTQTKETVVQYYQFVSEQIYRGAECTESIPSNYFHGTYFSKKR